MEQVLIDTNIYLNFYRMSEQSMGVLDELRELIRQDKIVLCAPRQILDEFYRDKYATTRDFTKKLDDLNKINTKAPKFLKSYKKIKDWGKNLKKIQKINKEILVEYKSRISNPKSKINKKIEKIFSLANKIQENEAIIEKAYYRTIKGNPPRKNNNSFGDAIIWETIIANLTENDLTIISGDRDFESEIEEKRINEFLEYEWHEKTQKKLTLYTGLGEFINAFTKKHIVKKQILEEEEKLTITTIMKSPAIDGILIATPTHFANDGLLITGNRKICSICQRQFNSDPFTFQLYENDRCPDCQRSNIYQKCNLCGKKYSPSLGNFSIGQCDECWNRKDNIFEK